MHSLERFRCEHTVLLCSFFDQPQEKKDSLPAIVWGESKVLGYESQGFTGGPLDFWASELSGRIQFLHEESHPPCGLCCRGCRA